MRSRQLFNVAAGAGGWGDTGPAFFGNVEQLRWAPTTPPDTGQNAVMSLALLPREGDTGDGFMFATYTNLAAGFMRVPRQPTHDPNGAADVTDTGTPAAPAPIVSCGDRLRLKVTGGPVGGRLYVWTGGP